MKKQTKKNKKSTSDNIVNTKKEIEYEQKFNSEFKFSDGFLHRLINDGTGNKYIEMICPYSRDAFFKCGVSCPMFNISEVSADSEKQVLSNQDELLEKWGNPKTFLICILNCTKTIYAMKK